MACALFSRVLRRRSSPPSSFSVLRTRPDVTSPILPETDALLPMHEGAHPLSLDIPTPCLQVSLSPLTAEAALEIIFCRHEGYVQARSTTSLDPFTGQITKVGEVRFSNAETATRAASLENGRMIDGQACQISHIPLEVSSWAEQASSVQATSWNWAEDMADDVMSPARKRQKKDTPATLNPRCLICSDELTGPHSKPCLFCKKPWCVDCVKTLFVNATHDHERMPARCCGKVMHHGVAGGILSPAELEIYRLRYDEYSTTNPLYCPVQTCSAFMPPRLLDSTKELVDCRRCATPICMKCKQIADEEHVCLKGDPNVEKIKDLKYKTCPKCGTGVMRMFGCPHLRCQCGAHWCWDCQRPINVCYRQPCAAAREDGQIAEPVGEDEHDESDSVAETLSIVSRSEDVHEQQSADSQTTATESHASVAVTVEGAMSVMQTASSRTHAAEVVSPEPGQAIEPTTYAANDQTQTAEYPTSYERTRVDTRLQDHTAPSPTFPMPSSEFDNVRQPLALGLTIVRDRPLVRLADNLPPHHIPAPAARNFRPPTPAPTASATQGQSLLQDAPNVDTSAETAANAIVPPTPTNINLDDPDLHDWELEGYYFGEEPLDEDFDVWGCNCRFRPLEKKHLDLQHWMQDLDRYLECMRCFEHIRPHEDGFREKGKSKVKSKEERKRLAWDCPKCGVVYCGECKIEASRKGKVKGKESLR